MGSSCALRRRPEPPRFRRVYVHASIIIRGAPGSPAPPSPKPQETAGTVSSRAATLLCHGVSTVGDAEPGGITWRDAEGAIGVRLAPPGIAHDRVCRE